MNILLVIDSSKLFDATGIDSIEKEIELDRCPNVGEWLEIRTDKSYFRGIITHVETYINLIENKVKYYIRMTDKFYQPN